jgi:DNA-directed RNA polymerase subunit RPC12/RpoP
MKKINEQFICTHCKQIVPEAQRTCRNHCPFCFVSLHVDSDIPGDRSAECGGEMYPTMYKISNGEMKILFVCAKCGKQHWNKRSVDDEVEHLDSLIKEYKSKFFYTEPLWKS